MNKKCIAYIRGGNHVNSNENERAECRWCVFYDSGHYLELELIMLNYSIEMKTPPNKKKLKVEMHVYTEARLFQWCLCCFIVKSFKLKLCLKERSWFMVICWYGVSWYSSLPFALLTNSNYKNVLMLRLWATQKRPFNISLERKVQFGLVTRQRI